MKEILLVKKNPVIQTDLCESEAVSEMKQKFK